MPRICSSLIISGSKKSSMSQPSRKGFEHASELHLGNARMYCGPHVFKGLFSQSSSLFHLCNLPIAFYHPDLKYEMRGVNIFMSGEKVFIQIKIPHRQNVKFKA